MIPTVNNDFLFNSIKQLVIVMPKCCVFFAASTEILNII